VFVDQGLEAIHVAVIHHALEHHCTFECRARPRRGDGRGIGRIDARASPEKELVSVIQNCRQ
jgi:hypothetical protein